MYDFKLLLLLMKATGANVGKRHNIVAAACVLVPRLMRRNCLS